MVLRVLLAALCLSMLATCLADLPSPRAMPAAAQAKTPFQPPRFTVNRVPPEYPESARSKRVSGKVVAVLDVSENGTVSGIKIVESEPPELFDASVAAAVYQWQFIPGCGKTFSQSFQVKVPFTFRFTDENSPTQAITLLPPQTWPETATATTRTQQGIHIGRRAPQPDCQ